MLNLSSWASPRSSTAMLTSVIFSFSIRVAAPHLGHFFCAARIFTVMNVYIGKRSEDVKKGVLAGHLLRIFRFRQDSGGKVADRHEPLVWEQQVFAQTTEIEPVIALPHFGLEAEVKVESVNVHRHAHTSGSHERLTIWYAKMHYLNTTPVIVLLARRPAKGRFFLATLKVCLSFKALVPALSGRCEVSWM